MYNIHRRGGTGGGSVHSAGAQAEPDGYIRSGITPLSRESLRRFYRCTGRAKCRRLSRPLGKTGTIPHWRPFCVGLPRRVAESGLWVL